MSGGSTLGWISASTFSLGEDTFLRRRRSTGRSSSSEDTEALLRVEGGGSKAEGVNRQVSYQYRTYVCTVCTYMCIQVRRYGMVLVIE